MKSKNFLIIIFSFLLSIPVFAQNNKPSDYISEETVASVVKLSSLLKVYTVDGLSDNYQYKTINNEPYFGDAKIISSEEIFVPVGTGVIVTENGLIITNAHVYGAYIEPEIKEKLNPAGNVMKGKNGKSIKQVVVNQYPSHMFVGICDIQNLKKNDDHQKLAYVAEKVVWDSDYKTYYRDRAILQIVNKAELDTDGLPVIGEKCRDNLKLPYSRLTNPFTHDYLETKVRAVGFPGVGDPNRSSKTSGELLGYENDKHSNILHTSWISNGNSGGGLFYNDKLIGINTWDNRENASRPVAIAQPNTYWNELFAYTKYAYPSITVPDYSYDWVDSDPSTEKYKNEAYVNLQLVHKENSGKPIRGGRLVVFNEKYERDFIEKYIEYSRNFESSWEIVKLLWKYDVEEVLEKVDISRELAYSFKNATKYSDLRPLLHDDIVPYYDLWCGDSFVYDVYTVSGIGKTMLSVAKNSNVKMIYLDDDDNESQIYTLKIGDKSEQGPFTVKIVQ